MSTAQSRPYTSITINETGETLFLDAAPSEIHNQDVNVAKHSVEGAGQVADHAEEKLESITIEGVIALGSQRQQGVGEATKQREAKEFFNEASEKLLTLGTLRFGVVKPVVLESIPHDFSGPVGQMNVSLSFIVVELAEWKTTELPPDQVQEETMAGKTRCGTKATNEKEPTKLEKQLEKALNPATGDAEGSVIGRFNEALFGDD